VAQLARLSIRYDSVQQFVGPDGVRFAGAAKKRGAQVTIIAGATTADPPDDVAIIRAHSAVNACRRHERVAWGYYFHWRCGGGGLSTHETALQKIKKTDTEIHNPDLTTEDILGDVAALKRDALLVIGFAAETENILSNRAAKTLRR